MSFGKVEVAGTLGQFQWNGGGRNHIYKILRH